MGNSLAASPLLRPTPAAGGRRGEAASALFPILFKFYKISQQRITIIIILSIFIVCTIYACTCMV